MVYVCLFVCRQAYVCSSNKVSVKTLDHALKPIGLRHNVHCTQLTRLTTGRYSIFLLPQLPTCSALITIDLENLSDADSEHDINTVIECVQDLHNDFQNLRSALEAATIDAGRAWRRFTTLREDCGVELVSASD